MVVSSPSQLTLSVGSESYLSGLGAMVATPDVRAGRSGSPMHSQHSASRLLLPCVVQLRHQTGSQVVFRRVPVRVEDVRRSLVDSWAPSGVLSAPRVSFEGAPLVGQWPAWQARGPQSESCVCRTSGRVRSEPIVVGLVESPGTAWVRRSPRCPLLSASSKATPPFRRGG